MAMGKRVSVIIPTKGRADQLREALLSLSWQTNPVHELILVDDSSADDYSQNESIVHEFKAAHDESFAIHHLKGRGIGAADARNQGAGSADGEIFFFIDDDVVLERDYVKHMISSFSDEEVAGVTGVITNARIPGKRWLLFSQLFCLSTVSRFRGYMRRSGYPCYLLDGREPTPVDVMSGSNMSLRRDVFLKHLFDYRLSGYSYLEDADLSYRVSRKHRLLLNPSCCLVHNSIDKGVNENYYMIKTSYHRYIFKKNMATSWLNRSCYVLSLIADLILVTDRARKEGNKRLVAAALSGLSPKNGPK